MLISTHLFLLNLLQYHLLFKRIVGSMIAICNVLLWHNLVDMRTLLLHEFVDLSSKVMTTKRALRFHLKPFCSALFMKVMFLIAREDNQQVVWSVAHQAYRAIWHLWVLLGVDSMVDLRQWVQVAFHIHLALLVCCVKKAPLRVCDLRHDVLPSRIHFKDVSYLCHELVPWIQPCKKLVDIFTALLVLLVRNESQSNALLVG